MNRARVLLPTLLVTLAAGTAMASPAFGSGPVVTGAGSGSCTGEAPVVCQIDVPPGNYDVSVLLGDADVAASTAVRAEARRMMLAEVATQAGRFTWRSFGVNVREPEGEPTKTASGTPGLTLTFTGAAPHVRKVTVRPARPAQPVLYLAGDSTVCDQDTFPYTGWGQAIPQHLRPGLTVANYADSGESTASFLADPRLFGTLQPLLKRGDVVLIQFGHNDKATTAEDYRANLTQMITEVRAQGARPVLISPPVRRLFGTDGLLNATALHVNGLGVNLPAEMELVAQEQTVPYVNLTADSAALVQGLGIEESKALFLTTELKDNTHFSEYGADQYAQLVLSRLRSLRVLPHVR
ncbi:MAG TPA: rhamnogalacturonan acetylesterase [Actinoplanes sp.]